MLSSVSANASTYYHRTPTRATARKAYYTTDTKSHTFRANGNYNRWTFRANHDLKNYRNTVWTTTQQTDIIMHGKKVRYYWVHNSKNGATGWIWSGYLKPVKAKAATPSEAYTNFRKSHRGRWHRQFSRRQQYHTQRRLSLKLRIW